MLTAKQIIEEYRKCYMDKSRIYMIENYLTTFDATRNETVPFKLFPKQKELLRNLSEYTDNITSKPRQSGISTTASAYIACQMALAPSDKPETVLIIANNLDLSKTDLEKIRDFLLQLPRWFWGGDYYGNERNESKKVLIKNNDKYLETVNGSKVYAKSGGKNSSRGISACSYLVIDEASFLENGMETYTAAASTMASSKKSLILISTPNGSDELYKPIYDRAKAGKNGFKLTELKWYQDPRYNKNLKWVKYDKESLKKEEIFEETLDVSGSIEYNEERWEDFVNKGYKPTSPWYVNMCNTMNHDKKRIAQELDVSFLGSAGTVLDPEYIDFQEKTNTREPIYIDDFYRDAWIFKEPEFGHRYIMPVDVSNGSGEDSSAIHILDIDAIDEDGTPIIEQVFEYNGKLQGDILGELADKYGRYYGNAFAVVDCIGQSGDACVLKMQSLSYPNLYYDDANLKNITSENPKLQQVNDEKKMPGFRAGYVRMQMLMNLEKMLRFNEVRPRSKRFMGELHTWIWKNGRPDHQSGSHDDTITSMAMGLFIYLFSFKKLEAVKEKTKAILRSMVLVQNAVNGSILNAESVERVKKLPLPFYTAQSLEKANTQQMSKYDMDRAVNKQMLKALYSQIIRR